MLELAPTSRRVDLVGPAGALEALLEVPEGPLKGAGVVCHPHPLHGGTMHNKIVYQAAKGLVDAGCAALRFNFRGTGRSAGEHDGGRGERTDVAAALALLRARFAAAPQVVAGFSFGATVGLRAASTEPQVVALIGIGLPVQSASFEFLEDERRPTLILQGEEDPFGPLDRVRTLAAAMGEHVLLQVVPGAGHFLDGQTDRVREAVRTFCSSNLGEGGET